MTDELQTPAQEAGDEVVTEETSSAPEAAENTEGQDDSQPAEAPEGAEDEVSPSKARRDRRKAEMQRLRDEKKAAEEREAAAQERLRKFEEASASQVPPKEEDFQDYNQYLMALGAHQAGIALDKRARQEVEEQQAAAQQRMAELDQQSKQEMAANWKAQSDDARSRYADFDQVVGARDLAINDTMAQMIAGSDVGADVAYFLGTNKTEAARIAGMEPLEAARAIGAIEARLSLPQPKTKTEAPDPIRPVKPKATASLDPSKMTMEQYAAARKAGKI